MPQQQTLDLGFARDRRYAVLGLGKSGLASARALAAAGAEVLAWDDTPAARDKAAGVPLRDLAALDWQGVEALVLSPGIPHTWPRPHPVAAAAKAAGKPIIGDIELLALAEPEARYVGITGTNGKSTTTALIGHLLQQAGKRIAVGGNLGTPVLTFPGLGAGGIYVLEMSSYQLELIRHLTFDVAILLNITPDHLERHGGMAGYIAAKRRIFDGQQAPRVAIVGIDDAASAAIADELKADPSRRVWPLSVESRAPGGLYVADGWLVDDTEGQAARRLDLGSLPRLPGRHNWQNVLAAYGALRALEVPAGTILRHLPGFPGLAHRQELVGERDGVRFVNDSKATNADAAAKALGCYEAIYWILGGRAKETGLAGLEPFFPRIRQAFLIGEATAAFRPVLDKAGIATAACGELPAAVAAAWKAARQDAAKGAVVLLSPACASFDQYPNFEVRGDHFRQLVQLLLEGGEA
jgi:UDP-N-acetylmuramoylalanine--D-glutamate ligase